MPPPTAQFLGSSQAGENESQNQSSGQAEEQNQEHGQGPTPILNQIQPAPSQPQHQQPRNESISYYTNFNQPRYSTDASINSFLNISDNVPVTGTGGPNAGSTYSNLPRLSTSSTHQPPDLSQIGRGFSIVNNLFPQQQQLQNQHRQQQQQQQQPQQQPPFKTPSFSTGLTGSSSQYQFLPRNDNTSQPPSKRNSVYLGPNDGADFEFFSMQQSQQPQFQPSSSRESNSMRPPLLIPTTTSKNQSNGINNSGNISTNADYESFFSAGANNGNSNQNPYFLSSRNNSLKFNPEDFDFQFKRRNSSVRGTLDHSNQNAFITESRLNSLSVNNKANSDPVVGNSNVTDSVNGKSNEIDNDVGNDGNNNKNGNNNNNNDNNDNSINSTSSTNIPNQEDHSLVSTNTTDNSRKDLKEIEQRLRKHLNDEDNYPNTMSRPLDKNPEVIEGSEGSNKHIDESGMQPNISKKRKKDDSVVYVKNEAPHVEPPITKDNSVSAEGAAMGSFSGKEPPMPDMGSVGDDATNLIGATKVDQLMLIIQARKKGFTEKVNTTQDGDLLFNQTMDILPPKNELVGGVEKPKGTHNTRAIKKHECPYCHRLFSQATHLEVHVRSHIGYKPFVCDYCGKRFTQGGNLRTHERLHTGEKPYSCDICDKKFSRKGNLAAHLVTHQKLKPFVCKLENCNKTFTQLGNMKAHQNRFHKETLNALTAKLAEMNPSENIPLEERQLLEYFASIYKNSNRGIKGRGKGVGTKKSIISSPENHPASTILNPNASSNNVIANDPENAGNPEGNIDNNGNSNPASHTMISPTQKDMGTLQSQFIHNNFNNSVNSSNSSNQPIINYNYTTLPHSRLGSSGSNNTNTNNNNFSVGAAPGVLMAPAANNDFSFNLDQSNDNERSQQEQVRFKNINYKS
ncbi:Azf1p [Saccharomyces paradoxus]|uniref:Azf1p n=1 Tax=Saccharomyces paradoxus TaxID=27291 RepID=A0A8B8UZR5_SACPA|nr:Azf1 [Saccharomyces paradoxus]QHS76218.1 Azf1 [Saccharomyces paradoxus]